MFVVEERNAKTERFVGDFKPHAMGRLRLLYDPLFPRNSMRRLTPLIGNITNDLRPDEAFVSRSARHSFAFSSDKPVVRQSSCIST